MKKISLVFGLSLMAFYACNNSPKADTTATITTPPVPTREAAPAPSTPAVANTAKTVDIEGKLVEVEDAGYPMAFLSVVPNGQSAQISINFNQEVAPVFKVADLSKMLNKTVAVSYEEKNELVTVDIHVNGKSIVDTEGEPMPEWQKISGTLTATEATKGDMPSTFSIKTADGKTHDFEYFITPEMVAQNGKIVDVYAMQMPQMSLKAISVKQ